MKRTARALTGIQFTTSESMGPQGRSMDGLRASGSTRRNGLLFLVGLALLAACGSSRGPNEEFENPVTPSSPSNVEALSEDPRVDLPGRVSVFLRVTTASGAPAANLTGADFRIYENGSLVSATESFQQIRAQPQVFRSYMHLVLDRSNSVQANNAADVQAGAIDFINVVTEQESNYVKISWFDGSPDIYPIAGYDVGFTNDRQLLLAAIAALNDEPPFSTSTNLYGAVISGIEDLDEVDAAAELEGVQNRSLALVTFTDGTHQSGATPTLGQARAAIDGMSAAGVPHSAFTIGVGQEIDPAVLQALGPDGSVAAANFPVLADAFEEVGNRVRDLANSFYFLTYCSPKTSGINQLRVSVQSAPSGSNDASFEFDATGFGAGCAFLDIRNHPELGAGHARTFVTDAVELPDGTVAAVGWRTASCLEPGCASAATAFVARFQASPATAPDASGDGRLDTSFGTGGFLDLEGPAFAISGATSVDFDAANGRLLVGGWARANAQSGFTQAAIWEVDAAGTAAVRTDLPGAGGADQAITDLVRADSGAIYAAGFRGTGSRSFAAWKLFPNLTLDTGFGIDGVALEPATPDVTNRGAEALAIDSTGRLYVIGEAAGGIRAVALDGTGGTLEAGFGGTGIVDAQRTIGGTTYGTLFGDALVDSDDRLLIGGTLVRPIGAGGVGEQPALWRILPSGAVDPSFTGSVSSPTFGSGVVTLRAGSTSDPARDFGRNTRVEGLSLAPDDSILAVGHRRNAPPTPIAPNTDMTLFSFSGNGVSRSAFNFVGFLIDDGASADDSFEEGSVVRVLGSGAIWTLGVSNPQDPAVAGGSVDLPTVWVDRDPTRVFAPLGVGGM